jgi:hypothetical protein
VNPYAVKYGYPRACGFGVLSLGLWAAYWLHRNRKLFDGELGRGRDDALFHAIGHFVPILNVFVDYWLYRDLDELRRRVGLRGIPVAAYVVGAIFAFPVVYLIALAQVNEFWDVRTGGAAVEAPVTRGEKAVLAAGAAWWLLTIAWLILVVLYFFEVGPLTEVV